MRWGPGDLGISKPHGSINLFVDKARGGFYFARPYFAGGIQPAGGGRNYLGFVPPRFNRRFQQHPVAEAIIEATRPATPDVVTFWGIGLTDSDRDLLDLYRTWTGSARRVEFINPSTRDADRAARLLSTGITHYHDLDAWRAGLGVTLPAGSRSGGQC